MKAAQELQESTIYDVTEQHSPEPQRTGQRRKEAILTEMILSKKSDTATGTDNYRI